jgi:hypothetical protein
MSKMDEYRSKCNCPPCPPCPMRQGEGRAGVLHQQEELLYHGTEGMLLPDCPVHQELGLKYMYYCIRGNGGTRRTSDLDTEVR